MDILATSAQLTSKEGQLDLSKPSTKTGEDQRAAFLRDIEIPYLNTLGAIGLRCHDVEPKIEVVVQIQPFLA